MLNRSFVRAVLVGGLVVVLALFAWTGIQRLQQPEPVRDFDPATLLKQRPALDVSYVSTDFDIVRSMLQIGEVGAADYLVDLGSGDGRIPIIAAQSRGARGLGVDIDPARVREADMNAQRAGVTERVAFRQEDLFVTPLGEVTVLTLYLLPEINLQLRPRILTQMRPGARIVSNTFDMGDWRPDRRETVLGTNIFLWIVPAQVAGRWQVTAGALQGVLELTQRYQDVTGTLTVAGRSAAISEAQLRGNRIAFTADTGGGRRRFEAVVDGGGMVGGDWQAVRTAGN